MDLDFPVLATFKLENVTEIIMYNVLSGKGNFV